MTDRQQAQSGFEPLPPHSTEAEECVLGSCLIDPDAFKVMAQLLRGSDFYHPRNQQIAEAMVRVAAREQPTDFILVCDELERTDQLELIGGIPYLSRLLTVIPTSVHVEHYARIVRRKAASRALIRLGTKIAQLAYEEADPERAFEYARRELEKIKEHYAPESKGAIGIHGIVVPTL